MYCYRTSYSNHQPYSCCNGFTEYHHLYGAEYYSYCKRGKYVCMEPINFAEHFHRFQCYGKSIFYFNLYGHGHCARMYRYGTNNGNGKSKPRCYGNDTTCNLHGTICNADRGRCKYICMESGSSIEC